ncbi:hypothetical protein D3C72_2409740 [compost metagenome]
MYATHGDDPGGETRSVQILRDLLRDILNPRNNPAVIHRMKLVGLEQLELFEAVIVE